ncbi:MAG: hypothetical protein AAF532_06000, partial [Planctomycetota bacterium]
MTHRNIIRLCCVTAVAVTTGLSSGCGSAEAVPTAADPLAVSVTRARPASAHRPSPAGTRDGGAQREAAV